MTSLRRTSALATALGLAGLALTACGGTTGGLSDFDRAQSASDVPDSFSTDLGVDEASLRLLADDDGVSFYAGRSGHQTCLLVGDHADLFASCATALPISVTLDDGTYIELAPERSERASGDWLTDNLLVGDSRSRPE
jgi:hypothetical protein